MAVREVLTSLFRRWFLTSGTPTPRNGELKQQPANVVDPSTNLLPYFPKVVPVVVLEGTQGASSEAELGEQLKQISIDKSPKEVAKIVMDVLIEPLVKLADDKQYERAVALLDRISQASHDEPFFKIAKGDETPLDRTKYYSGTELIQGTPALELEKLFIDITHEAELALELACRLTGIAYKAKPVAPLPQRHKAPKILVDDAQLAIVDAFASKTKSRSSDVDNFLGIHRNGTANSSLKENAFENRLGFLNLLLSREALYSQHMHLTLADEYHAYLEYQDKDASHKDIIDTFLNNFDGYKINNFSNRVKLAKFLEEREAAKDMPNAIVFFKDLTRLKNKGIDGTYDLLMLAATNHDRHLDQADFTNGFYEHAKVAYSLVNTNVSGFKVLGVAKEEINDDGKTIQVPRKVGDIDILGTKDSKQVFIEVKATACAAEHHKDQISSLIEFARKKDTKAVLIVGNLGILIRKAQQYSPSQKVTGEYSSTHEAFKKVKFLADLVKQSSGDLLLWDKDGKDITATVCTVAGKGTTLENRRLVGALSA